MSKDEILTRIITLYGGRAAEQLVFESVTTGASNDIEKATSLARSMVTQYGMSDKFGLVGLESVQSKYLDGRTVLNCGDATEAEIDKEVMKILRECYEKAQELLSGDREALDKLAEYLIEHETITGKEFMKIFRKVKGLKEPEGDLFNALVLDVDGTLLGSDKNISDATRDAIVEAQERGKVVAIASGRSISGIRRTAAAISLDKFGGYVIANNGTSVVNCKTGECVYNQFIDSAVLRPVFEVAKSMGIGIGVYRDERKEFISGNGHNTFFESDARELKITFLETEHFLKDVNFPVNKIMLAAEPSVMGNVEREMRERFGDRLNVFRSDACFVELLPRFVDKGVAVDKLVRHLGIGKEQIICVGDSLNDLPMIRIAGMGVAMGNAQDEIKRAADYVTGSNDEDGIVTVIEKFMKESSEKDTDKKEEDNV